MIRIVSRSFYDSFLYSLQGNVNHTFHLKQAEVVPCCATHPAHACPPRIRRPRFRDFSGVIPPAEEPGRRRIPHGGTPERRSLPFRTKIALSSLDAGRPAHYLRRSCWHSPQASANNTSAGGFRHSLQQVVLPGRTVPQGAGNQEAFLRSRRHDFSSLA